ncbi:hypothetical protein DNTS_001271 [Danionella cerebrum]|uniref:SPIN-DOC-like zinc-finger domain-containing protein n=1 Tax=Danionella cerebrum TaxID=2873325 RepID=A0A553MZW6_9TELE|nr:hypothetical protein DNTS_001271 [Danionella translucida]
MDEAESVHEAEQRQTDSSIIKADEEEDFPEPTVCSLGTSYWSVSESADSPFLLNPIPGPSTQDSHPSKATPGRDHRRYYHGYWRSEYLMDFDPLRQGMICMVCGSSLATLKLSTIKRHIKQKHPYSLLWSQEDKDVIRSGWDDHLNRESSRGTLLPPLDAPQEGDEVLDEDGPSTGDALSPVPQDTSGFDRLSPSLPVSREEEKLSGPTIQVMERYLNDSLQAWFRQEFLMEYQAEAGRLVCMVCSCLLPSLHLDHIKSHMLELHPNSLLYTAEEKHSVLQAWAKKHRDEPHALQPENKWEQRTKEINVDSSSSLPLDLDPVQSKLDSFTGGDENPPDAVHRAPSLPYQPRKRRLKHGSPWRLRLDYLVAFGPPEKPLCYCMVCSEHLPVPRVTKFRAHIQECHPETSNFSRSQRDAVVSAWVKEDNTDGAALKEEDPIDAPHSAEVSLVKTSEQETEDANNNKHKKGKAAARHSHYPGKDQRRNYQTRWKTDFLMDYDCRKHGLICMVCGATLATVKVSTIKRHILQVHPHSLDYSPEERQLVLLCYNQISTHFHSDQCFSGSNHGHKENANGKAFVSTECTSSQST